MQWYRLTNLSQLEEIKKQSTENPILIFKYSTRCSASKVVLDRLERHWKDQEMQPVKNYFLDLISYREISNAIENTFGVEHESPQVLVIVQGKVIYHSSHFGIDYEKIKQAIDHSPINLELE